MKNGLERLSKGLTKRLSWISGMAFIAMILMICGEIVSRRFYRPIEGAYEIAGFLVAIAISMSIAYAQVERSHISVEVVVSKLPKRVQLLIDAINWLVSTILLGLLTWRLFVYAVRLRETGEVSSTLRWPIELFVCIVALGFAALCLVLFIDFCKSLSQLVRK